jgi:hypothetical protein
MWVMAQITNEIIFEILKNLQAGVAEIKATLADHTHQLIRVREDINALRGDDLRRESLQAQMDTRLQRIENRLNRTDA